MPFPNPVCSGNPASVWQAYADQVLSGQPLNEDQALAVLRIGDEQLPDLLAAAFRVRYQFFGKTVQLYFLMNAKSGLCPEDCAYCSQSKVSGAEIPRYNLLSREKLLDGARMAQERNSKTYCIVISARGPNQREMQAIRTIVPEIKEQYDLKICVCLGLLTAEQARELKAAGVDRVNHNVNTGPEFYDQICTTHTYRDRINTLKSVRAAGLELCSGGIVGMGERDEDLVQMAMELRSLAVESIPINFLHPISGTPLEDQNRLTPSYCLKVLAMFRLVNPSSEIRIAGGRELHLRSLQPLGLFAANSMFVGDYLTTKGQAPEEDYRMIEDLGFTVTRSDETSTCLPQSESAGLVRR